MRGLDKRDFTRAWCLHLRGLDYRGSRVVLISGGQIRGVPEVEVSSLKGVRVLISEGRYTLSVSS